MENIRLFNCYTTTVMAHLYGTFPVKQYFDVLKFVNDCRHDQFSDEQRREILCHSLIWLKDNDFITYAQGDTQTCAFSQVTLTMRGFTVLSQETPTALIAKSTLGADIKDVAKKGMESSAVELLKTAFINSHKIFGA